MLLIKHCRYRVRGVLNSIAITQTAARVIYIVDESLDISGLEVTGYYSDGSSRVEDITTANISGLIVLNRQHSKS